MVIGVKMDNTPKSIKLNNGKYKYMNFYWVPIVAYNKDFLCGYLHSNALLAMELNIPRIDVPLDSTKLSDIIDDKGTRVSDLKAPEVEKLLFSNLEDHKNKQIHPDNKPGILRPALLELTCSCGNYYAFNTYPEIPEKTFSCGVCNKVLIDYTGKYDNEYQYNGSEN
jgi:hypothetical protein